MPCVLARVGGVPDGYYDDVRLSGSLLHAVLVASAVAFAALLPLFWIIGVSHFGIVSGPEPTERLWARYTLWSLPPAIAALAWILRHFLTKIGARTISVVRACIVAAAGLAPVHASTGIITVGQYGQDSAVFLAGLALSFVTLILLSAWLSAPAHTEGRSSIARQASANRV